MWLNWDLKVKVSCRFTGVLSVEGVLNSEEVFGENWQRPVATVIKPTRTW